jgi:hypothetical protein
MIPADLIARAKSVRVEDELARRGFLFWTKPRHSNLGQPCPMCGRGKDCFSVNVKKQVFNCRRCGKAGDVISLVRHLDGGEFRQAIERLVAGPETAFARPSPERRPGGASQEPQKPADDGARRTEAALKIWDEARDARGTLVEFYLKGRCLELPEGDCSQFMRFHGNCPFGQERFPALVALIRSIATDAHQGIQRTALNSDGTAVKHNGKTLRMTLGPMAGGAIKIDADADVTLGVCIGEGMESTLAGRQLGFAPAWALLSASGIAKFPALSGLESLTIFRENDDASRKAVEECGSRWHADGCDVFTVRPEIGSDLNDEIREVR